jgi:hypothetical protein
MHELIFSKRLPEMRCEIKRRRGDVEEALPWPPAVAR